MSLITGSVLAHIMAYEAHPDMPDALVLAAFNRTRDLLRAHSMNDVGLAGAIGRARDGRYAFLVDPFDHPDWCIAFRWDFDSNHAWDLGLMPVW